MADSPFPQASPMPDPSLRDILINRVLPRVQSPGQYIGGEWNSICKDAAAGARAGSAWRFPSRIRSA